MRVSSFVSIICFGEKLLVFPLVVRNRLTLGVKAEG